MRAAPHASLALAALSLVGGLAAVERSAGSQPAPATRFEHRFRIDSERVSAGPIEVGAIRAVARGSYSVEQQADGKYKIRGEMRGTHVAYKTRLGFTTEGRLVDGAWMPTRYVARVHHDSVLAEERTRETRIEFDYARGRAFARATSEKEGTKRVVYDTHASGGVVIDRNVKDPISALMDVLTTDRAGEVPLRTVVNGAVVSYRIRDLGRQNVTIRGAAVACRVRSLSIPAGAIDPHPYQFTLWSRQGNGRHILQARIAPQGSSLIARYERTIQ